MAKRQVFLSFHYDEDYYKAQQIRNMGVVEGKRELNSNEWEEVKRKGDKAIKTWIDDQLKMRSCTIVLIGQSTAYRKWVKYEIESTWKQGKGLVGIYINNLKDDKGQSSELKGKNPFKDVVIDGINIGKYVKPHYVDSTVSKTVYKVINENISDWIEEGIDIRSES